MTLKKLITTRLGESSWKWCSRAKTLNSTDLQWQWYHNPGESEDAPASATQLGQQSSPKITSGTPEMNSSQMPISSLMRASMPWIPTLPPKFPHPETWEKLKLMLLQHNVQYHEARDWIWLQDQSQITYKAFLTHCHLLKSWFKQYQKAKEKGWADHTSLTTATSSASSIQKDTLSTFPKCSKCGYPHPKWNAQLKAKNVTAVVTRITTLPCVSEAEDLSDPPVIPNPPSIQADYPEERQDQGTTYQTTGADKADPPTDLPAAPWAIAPHSPSPYQSNRSSRCNRRSIPFQYYQDSIAVIPAPSSLDSIEISTYQKEGSLLKECTSDGQVSFYTHLMLPTKNGMKSMMVKIDLGAQVHTIPLSRYWKLLPNKINESRYPKQGSLIPTNHSWIFHDGKP